MRRLLFFLLLVLGVAATGRFWYFAKDGFNINRLQFPLEERVDLMEGEMAGQLQGPYFYLGKGRQVYAFSSQDGKSVLKIPRFDRYELPFRWRGLPDALPQKQSISLDRASRLHFTLESFRIAANELKEQTKVLYLHLHRTKELPKHCILYDSLGRSHEVDLNKIAFILQEKKTLMMPQFLNALEKKEIGRAKEVLTAFLDVIEARAHLGIFNKDPSFLKNFGLEGNEGVQIDIGSFYRKEGLFKKDCYLRSMHERVRPLCEWLDQIDPDLLTWFQDLFEKRVQCE